MKEKKSFLAEEALRREKILSVIREGDPQKIRSLPELFHLSDIATVLEELSEEETRLLFLSIGVPTVSELLSYTEDSSSYLLQMDMEEAADILEQMDAEDAKDVLEELDEELREDLWERIEEGEVKEDLSLLCSYSEDEIGSHMSTDFATLSCESTVKSAMRSLLAQAENNDNITTLFVTHPDGRYYGAVALKDLIRARSEDSFRDLVSTSFPTVLDRDFVLETIPRLRDYSEELIPVLSSSDGTLLGVLTARTLSELWEDEREDDYAKLAALSEEAERGEPLTQSIKKRIPWLLALLFLGLFVSVVVSFFEGVVAELPILVSFQALILGMAGNVGTQSLAVTVRGLGEKRQKKTWFIALLETRIAFLNGLLIGLLSFLIVGVCLLISPSDISNPLAIAGCVGGAMCFAMTVSGFTGAAIPLCFSGLGLDPAVASGPFITTVNDLVAVISYYVLAWGLLLHFH